MRIAIIAPLVAPIREPQRGGSQAFVADLAHGLIGRGHEVHLYAASGSEVPGVPVIDTGVDHRPLSATLYRASGAADGPSAATESAFARVYSAVREDRYDVIHNHAFDAPAVRLATGLGAPVVHTVHLPPDDAVAAALRHAAETDAPPTVAGVSEFQASAWRRVVPIDAILPPYVPTSLIDWSPGAGDGASLRRPVEPGKGSSGSHRHRPGGRGPHRYLRRELRRRLCARADRSAAGRAGRGRPSSGAESVSLGGDGTRGRRSLPGEVGRAVRHGRRRGAGVRDTRRRVRSRRLGEVIADERTGFLVAPDDIDAAADAVKRASGLSRTECRAHAERRLDLGRSLEAHERLYRRVVGAGAGAAVHG